MATDAEVIDGVFESMTTTELEIPSNTASPTQGSNPIPLTPTIVNWVLARLKAGRKPIEIRRYIKTQHPEHKTLTMEQIYLIMKKREAFYQAAYTAENPEPETP